jgi:DNA invertase Pin-like site-specific DNA recombinase
MTRPRRAVGYVRVSSAAQGRSGLGLEAQRQAITLTAAARGWTLEHIAEDVLSAEYSDNRPQFVQVLADLNAGRYDALIGAKLDRLTRSTRDTLDLLDDAEANGWVVVSASEGWMDTSSASGNLTTVIFAAFAESERLRIGERTKEGLAVARQRGKRLGAPPELPTEVVERVVAEQASGRSLAAIAAGLAADGVPTARGGTWTKGTVARVLGRVAAARATTGLDDALAALAEVDARHAAAVAEDIALGRKR